MEHKTAKKKKTPVVLKVLLAVLVLLLMLLVGAYAFVQVQLGKINDLGVIEYEDTVADTVEQPAEDDGLDWGTLDDVVSVKGVVNILLVGQDTRVEGERARSDSMILLSINKNTKQVTMVSLMRDLYVQIPGYRNNKMNAAFQYGGFELLDATIEENFGVPVDYNVEVDFSGFKDIIDAVGGIDIELTQEEADYMNAGYHSKKVSGMTAGMNHLDGEAALVYARIRYVGRYDFQRTYRQRTVIKTVFEKVRHEKWNTLLDIYNSVADDVRTDLTSNDMLKLGFATLLMGVDHINSYRLPTDDNYENSTLRGDSLVIKDWDLAREMLRAFLYSEDAGASLVQEENYS